ncbi:MAG: FtsX-like permease family protein [Pseudomonadota bacterium]
MKRLTTASLGFYRQRPTLWLVTLIGVTLGVAVIVAIDIATSSARAAMRVSLEDLYGTSTHQIGAGPGGIAPAVFGTLRQRFPAIKLAPVVEDRVRIGESTLTVLGIDPLSERSMRPNVVAAWSSPGADLSVAGVLTVTGGTLMNPATAAELQLVVGDTFTVHHADRRLIGRVLGISDAIPRGVLVTDIANLDEWRRGQGQLTRIDVNAAGDIGRVRDIIEFLPSSYTVVATEARADATMGMTEAFTINLTAMSLLALLIGAFLIFNAISFSVVQRREQFATYRALGATRFELIKLVLSEGMLFGGMGTALGIALGVWLGQGLTTLVAQTVNDLYFRVSVTGQGPSLATTIKGLLLGVGFTLIASVPAALEAARTQPSLAMRRSLLESTSRKLGLRLLPIAGGILVLAAITLAVSGQQLVAALGGLFLAIMAYALALPAALLALLQRVLLPMAAKVGRMTVLAVGSIRRSFSRTVVAIVALAVAVSATVGVSTMVDSFRSSVQTWLIGALDADIYVGASAGGLTDADREGIAELEGVVATGSTRRAWVDTPSGRIRVQAVDLLGERGSQQLLAGDPLTVWPAFTRGDGVLVSESHAYRTGLQVGDTVDLPLPPSMAPLSVVGIYRSYDVTGGAIVMAMSRYRTIWHDQSSDAMALRLTDGIDPATVVASVNGLFDNNRRIVATARQALTDRSMAVFDRTFLITDVLYWITVGIAFVGVTGALFALQLEQRVEIGTLRAMGMTRSQTGRYVLGQSIVIGLLAGVAAIPLGLGLAWLLIDVINRRAFGWTMGFETDGRLLLGAVLGAVLAAAIGGLLPAIRTVQLRPAVALRSSGCGY